MMSSRAEQALKALLPLEIHRSVWVPTRRLGGQVLLVGVAAPRGRAVRRAAPPGWWYAVRPPAGDLVAFAETSVVSAALDQPEPGGEALARGGSGGTGHPREAHVLLRTHAEQLLADFTAGRAVDPIAAAEVLSAYPLAVPSPSLNWLRACCADYFDWLAGN